MIIVVVVPFLNEEAYLDDLLSSLASQTRPPDRLVLVDDGSTDRSFEIASSFAATHGYVTVHRRPQRAIDSDRLATAAELRAFQWAVDQLEVGWDVVAKVDADLLLPPAVLATLEHEFDADANLGMAGPYISVTNPDGVHVRQRCPPNHVEGPTKFYRRECFEQISPLPQILGWDTLDEIRARMRGWRTASVEIPGGDPVHLRPMGSHDGLLRAHWRWGLCAYGYGEHPLHVVLIGIQKAVDPPRILGGLGYVGGWAYGCARRLPRAEPELRGYVHRDQLNRIRRRLLRRSRRQIRQ